MTVPSFDSARAVRFDLSRGAIRAAARDERLLLVPSSALVELIRAAPSHAAEGLVRALGTAIGSRAAARIGAAEGASVESFVTQLAGEAALTGLGALGMERWGQAMVVVLQDCPLPAPFLSSLVSSAITASSGRAVSSVLLAADDHTARILVSSERGARRVHDWIAAGTPWADALSKLQGGEA
ncbi:MAG: hypothetical protein ABSC94_16965 [Polyangiaceae bacterium]|jgi:hypothetical protein